MTRVVNVVDDIPDERTAHVLAGLGALDQRIAADLRRLLPPQVTGMRGSHGRLLDLIAAEGTRPSTLADGAWITKQAVGKRLRELEGRGLVALAPDPADRRAVLVRRTPDGDRVRAAAREAIAAMEDEWAGVVGPERYATFRAVLAELGAAQHAADRT